MKTIPDRKLSRQSGVTLVEVTVVCAMVAICILAVGVVFSDSHKSWNQTYQRAYCDPMIESHVAAKTFEAVIRRATCERFLLDNSGQYIEVYYFATETSPKVDQYAKMYTSGGTFFLEFGETSPRETLGIIPVCDNVVSCTFSGAGRCIRMHMTLTDNDHDVSLIASAIPQNQ